MDITAKQVLTLAAKYIGYKEKASDKDLYSFEDNAGRGNFTMFQAELDKAKFWNTPKNGYEWCTSFVAWCFWRIAGSEAKDRQRMKSKPKTDQYFQKDTRDGLPCHTGIVESVNGNTFVTIEGNYGNAVQRVTRYLGSTVYGFGRPKYTQKTEDEDMVRWKTIEDVPAGYREMAQRYIDAGALKGKGNGEIDLSEDMIRVMEIMRRYFESMMEGK